MYDCLVPLTYMLQCVCYLLLSAYMNTPVVITYNVTKASLNLWVYYL